MKYAINLTQITGCFLFLLLAQCYAEDTNSPTMASSASTAQAPAVDKAALLQKVTAALNPDAEGDRKELFRKGLAALADLNAAGMTPEQSMAQAKASLSGEKSEKMEKMMKGMWDLNSARMTEPATLEALRKGEMPDPALKRP